MASRSNGTVTSTTKDETVSPPVKSATVSFPGPPPVTKTWTDISEDLWKMLDSAFDSNCQVDVESNSGDTAVVKVTKHR